MNIPILVLSGIIMALNGILVLAYFHDQKFDPIYGGAATNDNQVHTKLYLHKGLSTPFFGALGIGSVCG
jgi:hypothetical protein